MQSQPGPSLLPPRGGRAPPGARQVCGFRERRECPAAQRPGQGPSAPPETLPAPGLRARAAAASPPCIPAEPLPAPPPQPTHPSPRAPGSHPKPAGRPAGPAEAQAQAQTLTDPRRGRGSAWRDALDVRPASLRHHAAAPFSGRRSRDRPPPRTRSGPVATGLGGADRFIHHPGSALAPNSLPGSRAVLRRPY